MRISKIVISFFCFTLLFMNTQCDDDDQGSTSPCDQTVVVDNGFYETATSDFYHLTEADIQDNCLFITIEASGCDGNSWSMVLVDSGNVAESLPEQRYLKFVLSNDEVCLAVFSQQRSFDLTPIQVEGSSEIILNIEGFEAPITYAY